VSGRPKRPAGAGADDLRELTRQAHEAVKDLRLAQREVRQDLDRARAGHQRLAEQAIALAVSAGVERIEDVTQDALDFFQGELDRVMEYTTALIGAGSAQELVQVIVNEAARSLAGQLILGLGSDGQSAVLPRPGRVYVTTDPALAPPGSLVIDGR